MPNIIKFPNFLSSDLVTSCARQGKKPESRKAGDFNLILDRYQPRMSYSAKPFTKRLSGGGYQPENQKRVRRTWRDIKSVFGFQLYMNRLAQDIQKIDFLDFHGSMDRKPSGGSFRQHQQRRQSMQFSYLG